MNVEEILANILLDVPLTVLVVWLTFRFLSQTVQGAGKREEGQVELIKRIVDLFKLMNDTIQDLRDAIETLDAHTRAQTEALEQSTKERELRLKALEDNILNRIGQMETRFTLLLSREHETAANRVERTRTESEKTTAIESIPDDQ